jgi:hypothetical protein
MFHYDGDWGHGRHRYGGVRGFWPTQPKATAERRIPLRIGRFDVTSAWGFSGGFNRKRRPISRGGNCGRHAGRDSHLGDPHVDVAVACWTPFRF